MFDLADGAITSYGMFDNASRVVVALSGGADSMSLLHFLVNNSERYGVEVAAAHVNHCLRGEESERDCRFVKEQCEKLGVPLYIKKVDVAKIAKERNIGTELCGREVRYEFFEELSSDGNTAIATAHTATDNAETILLNITRGCGLDGLAGIPPKRGSIVRPLIRVCRTDVEKYCADNNIPFVTDSTNLRADYSRNKIRLNVIPELSKINPSVIAVINRMSDTISSDSAYLKKVTSGEYNRCKTDGGLSIEALKNIDRSILPRVIKLAVEKNLATVPEKKHIELIVESIENGFGAVMIHGKSTVKVSGTKLVFISDIPSDSDIPQFEEKKLELDTTYRYLNKTVIISPKNGEISHNSDNVNKKLLNQRLSYDIILSGVLLRNRKSGDYFKPIGRNCTKTVKKLFTELKVPVEERGTRLLLADGSRVLWIEGIGASQDALAAEGCDYFTVEIKSDYE